MVSSVSYPPNLSPVGDTPEPKINPYHSLHTPRPPSLFLTAIPYTPAIYPILLEG